MLVFTSKMNKGEVEIYLRFASDEPLFATISYNIVQQLLCFGTEHHTMLLDQGSLYGSGCQHLTESCVPVSEQYNPTVVCAVNQNMGC